MKLHFIDHQRNTTRAASRCWAFVVWSAAEFVVRQRGDASPVSGWLCAWGYYQK